MISKSSNLHYFIDEIFPNISNVSTDLNHEIERIILTPKNEDVDIINAKVLNKINGEEFVYYSADEIDMKSDNDKANA